MTKPAPVPVEYAESTDAFVKYDVKATILISAIPIPKDMITIADNFHFTPWTIPRTRKEVA